MAGALISGERSLYRWTRVELTSTTAVRAYLKELAVLISQPTYIKEKSTHHANIRPKGVILCRFTARVNAMKLCTHFGKKWWQSLNPSARITATISKNSTYGNHQCWYINTLNRKRVAVFTVVLVQMGFLSSSCCPPFWFKLRLPIVMEIYIWKKFHPFLKERCISLSIFTDRMFTWCLPRQHLHIQVVSRGINTATNRTQSKSEY